MPRMAERDYYTVPQAAALLEVSPSTVWRWIKAGLLPAWRAGPKSIRIRKEDLKAVLRPAKHGDAAETLPQWATGPMQRPVLTGLTVPRLTAEEVEQAEAALRAADEVRAMIRTRRGGKPLASSAPIIRKARAERSRQLLP